MIKQEKVTHGVATVILIVDTTKKTFTIINTAYRTKEGKKEPNFTFHHSKSVDICIDVAQCLKKAMWKARKLLGEGKFAQKNIEMFNSLPD